MTLPRFLERFGECLERVTADRSTQQRLQLGGIGNQLDFFAQAFWDSIESNFQRFEDILLLGEDQTFLTAFLMALLATFEDTFLMAFLTTFLAELFGERTRFFATFLAELFGE
jgi:hypothetical protein